MSEPLRYYRNNTVNSRALIECAVQGGVQAFRLLLNRGGLWRAGRIRRSAKTIRLMPMSPYGWSKLMTEIMLRDASAAHGLGHVILRYFNVAGADPHGAPANRPRAQPISSRLRSRPRSDGAHP